jgi:hypothetical protein
VRINEIKPAKCKLPLPRSSATSSKGFSLFHSFDAEALASSDECKWREAGDSKPCRASTSQGNIKREGGFSAETPPEANPNISISVVEK